MGENLGRGKFVSFPGPPLPSPTRAASASNGRGLSGTLREMMALPLLLLVILAARTGGGERGGGEGGDATEVGLPLIAPFVSPLWPSSSLSVPIHSAG